jgi:lipopolysaccharide transport system ATP-binding protein
MGTAARAGRTILFVSHNLAAVQNLCHRAVLLERGCLVADGSSEAIVRQYAALASNVADVPLAKRQDRVGTALVRMSSVSLTDGDAAAVGAFRCGAAARLVLRYENLSGRNLRNVQIDVGIDDAAGQRVALLSSGFTSDGPLELDAEVDTIEVCIDRMPLMPGRYAFTLYFAVNGEAVDWIQNAGSFDVEPGDFFRTGKVLTRVHGSVLIDHRFVASASRQVPVVRS